MPGTVICLHVPRFKLITAVVRAASVGGTGQGPEGRGEAEGLLGKALALAPLPGQGAFVGEVSGAAEALGVRAGMRLGEALARAPRLDLVAPDPVGVAEAWELLAMALEGVGARPELERVGTAYFQADGLYGLHGGLDGVMVAARRAIDGVHRGIGVEHPGPLDVKSLVTVCARARLGAGPTRLCALVVAQRGRGRRGGRRTGSAQALDRQTPLTAAGARRYLAPLPVELLRVRDDTGDLVDPLRSLGIGTLGELSALPRATVGDRFGRTGLLAHDLASGRDERLRERPPRERVQESLELEDSTGPALDHALGVLLDRLLARPERRGRTLRALILSAALVEGGTWLERVVLREATVERERIRMTLSLRLGLLPAPAQRLSLRVERFGGRDARQSALMEEGRALRLERLREAARQVRAVAGLEGALRIVAVDELSRVPERRFLLTPFS